MERITLKVVGMSCGHCVKAVQEAISGVAGAEADDVTIGSATVSYDPAQTSPGALIDAVAEVGYEAHEVS